MRSLYLSLSTKLFGVLLSFLVVHSTVFSADAPNFGVAVQGYDVVGYFTDNKPVKGNGDHVVYRDGLDYLFATEDNKKLFEATPDKYLPQYGGWCAFGTSVGKKIPSDPTAWSIVDGKLYLNLNDRVKAIWSKDMSGYIEKADLNWVKIKNKSPAKL